MEKLQCINLNFINSKVIEIIFTSCIYKERAFVLWVTLIDCTINLNKVLVRFVAIIQDVNAICSTNNRSVIHMADNRLARINTNEFGRWNVVLIL